MADDLRKQVTGLWDRFRSKASDAVARQSAGLARGRTAARDVFDDSGNLLVGAGQVIDDDALERAAAAGKMPAVVAAAAAAQTQDIREKLQEEYERLPEGQDRRNLADSEEYLEARHYIRYVASVEVTDIRGNVLVAAGQVIQDEDVRRVRDAGQLGALIYSAQQSGPPPLDDQAYRPAEPEAGRPKSPTATLLGSPDEDESNAAG
jgi:hypothetical protein